MLESETDLANEQKRFDAERIEDENERLEKLKEVVQQEKDIELERLQTKIDSYKEGTQARLDAEIEYNTIKQQLDNELITLEDEQRKIRNEKQKEDDQKSLEREQQIQDAKLEFASNTFSAIANLAEAFAGNNEAQQRKAFKIQKAVSIAQATVDTYKAANSIFAAAALNPATVLFPAQPFIAAGLAVAGGLANVKNIASQEFGGGASGGGGGNVPTPNLSTPQSVQPNFNIVGDSGVNQLDALKSQPSKVYVVSGEVSSAQALDRNRIRNATF